jgi:CCR4-NOT transcription complex subunit 7/8
MKENVDHLKLIQIGITLSDATGKVPDFCGTYQFHLSFDSSTDVITDEAKKLLQDAEVDFAQHKKNGIEPDELAAELITSGLVCNENIKWICFHGCYDFAYFFRLLSGSALPDEESEFHSMLQLYFGCIYDIKTIMSDIDHLKGGLDRVAYDLMVDRVGKKHQAGSDSLVTLMVYFKIQQMFFKSGIPDNYKNHLFGLQISSSQYYTDKFHQVIERDGGYAYNPYRDSQMYSQYVNYFHDTYTPYGYK